MRKLNGDLKTRLPLVAVWVMAAATGAYGVGSTLNSFFVSLFPPTDGTAMGIYRGPEYIYCPTYKYIHPYDRSYFSPFSLGGQYPGAIPLQGYFYVPRSACPSHLGPEYCAVVCSGYYIVSQFRLADGAQATYFPYTAEYASHIYGDGQYYYYI